MVELTACHQGVVEQLQLCLNFHISHGSIQRRFRRLRKKLYTYFVDNLLLFQHWNSWWSSTSRFLNTVYIKSMWYHGTTNSRYGIHLKTIRLAGAYFYSKLSLAIIPFTIKARYLNASVWKYKWAVTALRRNICLRHYIFIDPVMTLTFDLWPCKHFSNTQSHDEYFCQVSLKFLH